MRARATASPIRLRLSPRLCLRERFDLCVPPASNKRPVSAIRGRSERTINNIGVWRRHCCSPSLFFPLVSSLSSVQDIRRQRRVLRPPPFAPLPSPTLGMMPFPPPKFPYLSTEWGSFRGNTRPRGGAEFARWLGVCFKRFIIGIFRGG